MLIERDYGYHGDGVKLDVYLTKEDIEQLRVFYEANNKMRYVDTIDNLLEALITEAEK